MPARTVSRLADLLRASLVAGVPALALAGEPKAALGMAAIAATALVLRIAPAPPAAHLVFVALLSADAWLTTTGLMARIDRDDTAGHLLLTAAVTPLVFHLGVRAGVLAAPRPGRAAALAAGAGALALTLALGVGWELFEGASDALLGTDMALGYADTLGDLAADVGGGLLGAATLAATLRPRRRAPARASRPSAVPAAERS